MSDAPGGARALLRRAPLLVVGALLAWMLLGDRPREVTLVYDLPDEPAPTRVEVRIAAPDGTVPALLAWGDGTGPAEDRRAHAAHLADGPHRLEARLTLPDGSTRTISRELAIARDDERIVLHLAP